MEEKSNTDILFENVPALNVGYTAVLTYIYHFIIFLLILVSFWRITSLIWIAALPISIILTSVSNIPFIYIAENYEKIRKKYLKKYKKNTWQHFWYHYSYTSPFGAAAFYAPLLLKTDYFLPKIVSLPSNVITRTLLPIHIALLFSIFFIVAGMLVIRSSQDHDRDMDIYINVIKPGRRKLYTNGIFSYTRHPRLLSRIVISIGFGIFANNILAICASILHFVPYYIYMKSEDKESRNYFGNTAEIYQKNVSPLFPRYGNWKKFTKLLITKSDK